MPNRWPAILGPERLAKGLFWTKAWSLYDLQSGEIVTHPERLQIPLKTRKPQVFAIWSDLFHEKVPLEFFQDAYVIMMESERLNLGHIFLLITKRPEHGVKILRPKRPLSNLVLITTAENQEQADKRLPIARKIPAACRVVLYEPALGALDIGQAVGNIAAIAPGFSWFKDYEFHGVIAGAETGHGARSPLYKWFVEVKDQCVAAGIPFFLKQIGVTGKIVKMPEFEGRVWNELPQL